MTELWLSGPVEGVQPLLMPAAHALLQVREDVPRLLEGLTHDQIWSRAGQSAPIGFHAIHLAGATDRLMTYARGRQLSEAQLAAVRAGEKETAGLPTDEIIARVRSAIDTALEQIRNTPPESLTDAREVGRKQLPATVIGLIFHAAEHATRHAGQIATLRQVVAS